MHYDFTTVLDRRSRDSTAADVIPIPGASVKEGFEPIPMWVADMSFPTAPPVLEAMRQRLAFPSLGYFPLSEEYYAAILRWQRERNGVTGLEKEHIGYENGVLGGISAAITMLTEPGEEILLHAPTYVGFTHVLDTLDRRAVHSPLKPDGNGIWRMDYEDMDRKLKKHHIRLAIFCSPHNPSGRVWEREELEAAMAVYAQNGCTVISDEIWSDIIMPGQRHIPTQSVSEDARQRTLAFYSPSKGFSLAGLVGAYHIVYNDSLRSRLRRESALSHYNSPNLLSMYALIGAYTRGADWLEEMCAVVDGNFDLACAFIREHFPGVKLMRPQGTYMLFLDCGDWCRAHGVGIQELLRRGVEVGVIWQNGEDFFWPCSIRLNLALPASQLDAALQRLKEYVFL